MRFSTLPIRLAILPSRRLTMQSLVSTSCLRYTKPLMSLTELDTLSEESYKDSTLIMQLLRDNLVGRLTGHSLHYLLIYSRLSGLRPRPSQAVARAVLLQRRPKRQVTQLLQLHLLRQKRLRSRCSSHYARCTSCIVKTRGRLRNGRVIISS